MSEQLDLSKIVSNNFKCVKVTYNSRDLCYEKSKDKKDCDKIFFLEYQKCMATYYKARADFDNKK